MSRPTASPVRTALWMLLLGALWVDVIHSGLATSADAVAPSRALWMAALAAFAARLAAQAAEAGAYLAIASLAGVRMRFGRLFVALFSLSMLDALAVGLARWNDGARAPGWLVALVGLRVIPEALAGSPGLRVSLGGAGLLAALRVGGTMVALVQQGMRRTPAIAAVLAAWCAGRLATWWMTDLARGMSPLP